MIYPYADKIPQIDETAFIADYVTIIGDVTIGANSSVWFNTTIRGDVGPVTIGARSNIQESSVLHLSAGGTLTIEDDVTIGHGCIIHGATICQGALVGMGATVLDGAVIGAGALIGAGSLVSPGKVIPAGVLALGNPAKVVRELTVDDRLSISDNAKDYCEKALIYQAMQK